MHITKQLLLTNVAQLISLSLIANRCFQSLIPEVFSVHVAAIKFKWEELNSFTVQEENYFECHFYVYQEYHSLSQTNKNIKTLHYSSKKEKFRQEIFNLRVDPNAECETNMTITVGHGSIDFGNIILPLTSMKGRVFEMFYY